MSRDPRTRYEGHPRNGWSVRQLTEKAGASLRAIASWTSEPRKNYLARADEKREHEKDPSDITVEYDVVVRPTGPTPYVNFEWDWGPRVYTPGAEFWSLGAAGFAGVVCDYFSGGLAASGGSIATAALWDKIAGNNRILNDQNCYDFSQALNLGWQAAPAEKCR